jgi:hypothetical protein
MKFVMMVKSEELPVSRDVGIRVFGLGDHTNSMS